MPLPFPNTIFVIAPGAALTPAHYGLLTHLLMKAGYGVLSSMLPSAGTNAKITVQDDSDYIHNRLILPVLDQEEHDVIFVGHSYSSLPGSAACAGLSKDERSKAGKKTSVLGQIYLAAILTPGGDGKDLVAAFGGQTPPHIEVDEAANLIRCPDAGPPLFHDVEPAALLSSAVASCLCPSLTSFTSPIPAASWNAPGYKGRVAYIKTTEDRAVPVQVQEMMLAGTGVEWITREIAASHDAQMAQAEKVSEIILEIAKQLQNL